MNTTNQDKERIDILKSAIQEIYDNIGETDCKSNNNNNSIYSDTQSTTACSASSCIDTSAKQCDKLHESEKYAMEPAMKSAMKYKLPDKNDISNTTSQPILSKKEVAKIKSQYDIEYDEIFARLSNNYQKNRESSRNISNRFYRNIIDEEIELLRNHEAALMQYEIDKSDNYNYKNNCIHSDIRQNYKSKYTNIKKNIKKNENKNSNIDNNYSKYKAKTQKKDESNCRSKVYFFHDSYFSFYNICNIPHDILQKLFRSYKYNDYLEMCKAFRSPNSTILKNEHPSRFIWFAIIGQALSDALITSPSSQNYRMHQRNAVLWLTSPSFSLQTICKYARIHYQQFLYAMKRFFLYYNDAQIYKN